MKAPVLWSLAAALALTTPARAQLAARPTDQWLTTLETPARIKSLKIEETVAALRLRPGQVAADIGAGSGLFEPALSAAVGPSGKVYAEDVDKGLVEAIAGKARAAGVTNVAPVLGRFTDPALPARDVDLAFINDVLHHVEDRPAFVAALARYLRPGGRIALIDFVPGKGGHVGQPELQVSPEQATAWMKAAGLDLTQEVRLFDDKYFLIFTRR